jgi:hypothetical protein
MQNDPPVVNRTREFCVEPIVLQLHVELLCDAIHSEQ